MKLKRLVITMVFALAIGTLLAACGTSNGGGNKSGSNGKSGSKKDFTVGMVTDTGGIHDKSFNQGSWEGLQKFAKENSLSVGNGKDVMYLESQSSSDYVPNLTKLVHHHYDLVYGVGFKMAAAVQKIALQNPNAKLAIIDSVVKKSKNGPLVPNVASITFKEQQGSFLVGVIAAKMTKTNKVGFIGGMKSDVISRFENGFIAGVKTVNPNIQVFDQYAGSFSDASKGKQIAAAMYSKGADIVFPAAGATGNGAFTEAKNRTKNGNKVWIIGVDRDQYKEGQPEGVTLTSMVKNVNKAVIKVSKETMDGNFPGGKHVILGLKENAVGPSKHHKHIPSKVMDLVKQYKQKIISGKLKVPGTKEALNKYLKNH